MYGGQMQFRRVYCSHSCSQSATLPKYYNCNHVVVDDLSSGFSPAPHWPFILHFLRLKRDDRRNTPSFLVPNVCKLTIVLIMIPL